MDHSETFMKNPTSLRTHSLALGTLLLVGALAATTGWAASDWLRFGGEAADFSAPETVRWPAEGPRELWRLTLGPGYSTIAVAGNHVYTMARDGQDDLVVALDAATGETRWQHRYSAPTRKGHLVQFGEGPHASPLILGDRITTLGYTGVLKALSRGDGKEFWSWHLLDDLGGELLQWGYSASPILEDGKVIVLVGGEKAGAVALDPTTGKQTWAGPKTRVSFATPLVIDVSGQRQLLYFSHDALHALDPKSGSALWSHEIKNGYENHASMPIWVPGKSLLWVVSQQEAAGRALRLTRTAEGTQVEEVWTNSRLRVHHWNSIVLGDTAYAAVGGDGSILTGVDLESGKMLWRERGYNKANFVHTPGGTLALDEDGVLTWLDLSPEGVEERGRLKVFDGVSWTAPTLVGQRLFLRDKKEIVALELDP